MVKRKASSQVKEDDEKEQPGENEGVEPSVKPIGDVIKRSGRGRSERRFYDAFELEGSRYNLEDSVLITPEMKSQKPYVAIIKEIKESKDGSMSLTGQWFYRPEEADKKGGGSWVSDDTRELFYSFHRDEVPAESIMHKCVVHFIPSHKLSPPRSKHPGFIVRKVYDTVEKKLWNLTDKDYEDAKQKEIDLLVQKTQLALGTLEDVEMEEAVAAVVPEPEKAEKPRKTQRKRAFPHPPAVNISREEIDCPAEEGAVSVTGKAETPTDTAKAENLTTPAGDGPTIMLLRQNGALTGTKARDLWLERILISIKPWYEASEAAKEEDVQFRPEEAVSVICALESAAYEAITEVHKYNLKMRQLEYNFKIGPVLVRRLLAKELEPISVVNMSPAELKDGMTAAEMSAREPEQPQTVQMASVRCGVCGEPQGRVVDVINALHGDKYQLECLKCGISWYTARDTISYLTTETLKPKEGNKQLKESEPEKKKKTEEETGNDSSPADLQKPSAAAQDDQPAKELDEQKPRAVPEDEQKTETDAATPVKDDAGDATDFSDAETNQVTGSS